MIHRALHTVTAADGTKVAWRAREPEAPAAFTPADPYLRPALRAIVKTRIPYEAAD